MQVGVEDTYSGVRIVIAQAIISSKGSTSTYSFLEERTSSGQRQPQECQLGEQLVPLWGWGWRAERCLFLWVAVFHTGIRGLTSMAWAEFQPQLSPLAEHFCTVHRLYHCTWQASWHKLGWKLK